MKAIRTGAVFAVAVLLGAAAGPKPTGSIFTKEPRFQDALALVPEAARDAGGYAAMRCKVTADARIADCRLVQETPTGGGFGRALLSLAPEYRVKSPAEGGPAPGSEIVEPFYGLRSDKPVDWRRKPTEKDLLLVWPKAAWAKGIGGKALIHCLVSTQGALYDCIVASESPAGENFGSAGIALTPQFLMSPATLSGKPVISMVSIPLFFTAMPGMSGSPLGSKQSVAQAMAWPEAPSYAEVAAAYPKKARATGVGGRATVSCSFNREGRLAFCNTVNEEPKGQGFGEAAKLLTKRFRAFTATSSGASITSAGLQLLFVFDPAMLTNANPVIGKAQWAGLPSAEETRAAFGKVETGHGTVRVTLACLVQQGGGVSDCKVTREEPAGIGVGPAALAMAPRFRLTTWTSEGLPTVGGTVNIPLRYEGGDAPPPATAKP